MKVTQMPPIHAANLVENSGNIAYGVDVIGLCYNGTWLKGLRPVLEGFVVPMHKGACETGSQIPRA